MSKSKELKEQISKQSLKIQTLDTECRNRISTLNTKIALLSQKARLTSMGISSTVAKKHEAQLEELKKLTSEKEQLEKTHKNQLNKEKRELRELRAEYRNRKDEFKKENQRIKEEKVKDFKDAVYFNKDKIIAALAISLGVVLIVILDVAGESSGEKKDSEIRQRDYVIEMTTGNEFDCNLEFNSSSNSLECQERLVGGTFTQYDDTEFRVNHPYGIYGGGVRGEWGGNVRGSVSKYDTKGWIKEDINGDKILEIPDFVKVDFYPYLTSKEMSNPFEEVFGKSFTVIFRLTDNDKKSIRTAKEKWDREEAEAEAQKEQEAAKRQISEAQREEERKTREAKEAEERAATEAQKAAEEESRQQSESSEGLTVCLRRGDESLFSCALDETETSIFGNIRIKGRLKNEMSSKVNFVIISFGVYDSSNVKTDTCSVSMTDLGVGDIWRFESHSCSSSKSGNIKIDDITWW